MADYTIVNVREIEDMAPRFGMAPGLESRFGRGPLGLERSGISHFRVAPGYRLPFGHVHREQEEIYLVLSGRARVKLDDDIVEIMIRAGDQLSLVSVMSEHRVSDALVTTLARRAAARLGAARA